MAVNLVSLIMQFLTPDMIGRIASALGLDRTNTQTAIGAAIPGWLDSAALPRNPAERKNSSTPCGSKLAPSAALPT
jgi:hypothetical protein